ncbi:hypothetical protein [Clostridium sp. DL1XJH146]
MESGIEEMSFEEYCNVFNGAYGPSNDFHFVMIDVLKEKFLYKTMELQDFDEEVRNTLFLDDNASIYMSDINDSIHNGFHYDYLGFDAAGYDFDFKLIGVDREDQEIFIKVVGIRES